MYTYIYFHKRIYVFSVNTYTHMCARMHDNTHTFSQESWFAVSYKT